MVRWLHKYGYTYFTIPKLTYAEISDIAESEHRENKAKERKQREAARKNKMKRR